MRILACTDVHEPDGTYAGVHDKKGLRRSLLELKNKHKAEILICCGDFSVFGNSQRQALEILKSIKLPTFTVHGNHDDYDQYIRFCKKTKNFSDVHEGYEVYDKDTLIFGWGGGRF